MYDPLQVQVAIHIQTPDGVPKRRWVHHREVHYSTRTMSRRDNGSTTVRYITVHGRCPEETVGPPPWGTLQYTDGVPRRQWVHHWEVHYSTRTVSRRDSRSTTVRYITVHDCTSRHFPLFWCTMYQRKTKLFRMLCLSTPNKYTL